MSVNDYSANLTNGMILIPKDQETEILNARLEAIQIELDMFRRFTNASINNLGIENSRLRDQMSALITVHRALVEDGKIEPSTRDADIVDRNIEPEL